LEHSEHVSFLDSLAVRVSRCIWLRLERTVGADVDLDADALAEADAEDDDDDAAGAAAAAADVDAELPGRELPSRGDDNLVLT